MNSKTNNSMWLKTENLYSSVSETTKVLPELPRGVYNLTQDPRTLAFELERLYDSFELPFKVYSMEDKFISHVLTTFTNTTTNLGILLHGTKGTGKTVTAKILANKMDLPVILISQPFERLSEYLASLETDCVLFFDEYEKNFSGRENDGTILSIMDGVYNTKSRKIFILTTNSIDINDNLLSRPSRIRYKKSFGNLDIKVIREYLRENLDDQNLTSEVCDYVNTLSEATIDILKSVVDELNLHKCPVSEIKDIMNLQVAKHFYSSYMGTGFTSKEQFLSGLKDAESAVKNGEKDRFGDAYEDISDYPGLEDFSFSLNFSISNVRVGDTVGYYKVIEPLDENNVITIDRYNEVTYLKVLNVERRPVLYRGL